MESSFWCEVQGMQRLFAILLVLMFGLSSLTACAAAGTPGEETESPPTDVSAQPGSSVEGSAGSDGSATGAGLPPASVFHLDFSSPLPVKESEEVSVPNDTSPFLLTDSAHRMYQEEGYLRVEGNRFAQPKSTFSLVFAEMDMTLRPTVSLAVRADRDTNLNLALEDADGKRAFVLGSRCI